jgi:hypothetical protein
MAKKVEWELQHRGVIIDFTKNPVLMRMARNVSAKAEGEAKGKAEILHGQLETKFGQLPRWADIRMSRATPCANRAMGQEDPYC